MNQNILCLCQLGYKKQIILYNKHIVSLCIFSVLIKTQENK